jgi:hypothetical protein
VAAAIDALYASIIPAGTHLASSIRVAEAAKVIENTQRDVCRVPDDWLIGSRRGLLLAREVMLELKRCI